MEPTAVVRSCLCLNPKLESFSRLSIPFIHGSHVGMNHFHFLEKRSFRFKNDEEKRKRKTILFQISFFLKDSFSFFINDCF